MTSHAEAEKQTILKFTCALSSFYILAGVENSSKSIHFEWRVYSFDNELVFDKNQQNKNNSKVPLTHPPIRIIQVTISQKP